jgi:hypothetical protein
MPSVTLHLVMADRVLERWQERPWDAPFDPYDPVCINAFQQGSFGPDLGYFPGGTASFPTSPTWSGVES